jgi:hypothetical protein
MRCSISNSVIGSLSAMAPTVCANAVPAGVEVMTIIAATTKLRRVVTLSNIIAFPPGL